jgi:hypothetical protein
MRFAVTYSTHRCMSFIYLDGLDRLVCSHSELVWNSGSHRQTAGPIERVISSEQGHNPHRTTRTQKKQVQTFMPRLRFEPTAPVFEREKTIRALDRAATVANRYIKKET